MDASAVLAILLEEDDAETFTQCLARVGPSVISAVNYWEALVRAEVIFGEAGHPLIEDLLSELGVAVVPIDDAHARVAARAFARFGGRPGGRLNLGDCFAYALAEQEGEGLLFKGNDFPKTDVRNALDTASL